MSPQIEKTQFRNETGGFIGVVSLSAKGEERGIPVAPGETVWLSEDEQILTANAPRLAEHNPFIAQKVLRRNPETDAEEEIEMTPLVPISENRFVPANDRPIPADGAAAPAAEVPGAAPEVPEAPSEPQEPSQPVEEPLPAPPVPTAPLPPAADRSLHVPEDEGRAPQAPVEEETAAVSPGPDAEETGAALTPSGDAPQGEYQAGEEVGTPDAPATTPPPFTEG